MRVRVLLLLTAMASGCGSAVPEAWPHIIASAGVTRTVKSTTAEAIVRARAMLDFGCSSEDIRVEAVGEVTADGYHVHRVFKRAWLQTQGSVHVLRARRRDVLRARARRLTTHKSWGSLRHPVP